MRTFKFVLALTALTLSSGCGGDSPTDGGGGGGGGSAPFTATINGQAWAADQIGFQVTPGSVETPGSLTISGTQVQSASNYRSLVLTLAFISGTGTFPLGINIVTTPGGTGIVTVVAGASSVTSYFTPLSGNAGSVTITTLTSARMVGTFTFTAPPLLGGGAALSVTNGTFDIELPSSFVAATGNNRGSAMSATIGGTAWTGATIVAVGQTGIFSFNGSNTERSVSITPTLPVTPGTYAIGNGAEGISVQVTTIGTPVAWGPTPGSTGTVTFTSVGGGRIAGTFSGVLAPVGGTGAVGNLTIANGTFDIRAPGT